MDKYLVTGATGFIGKRLISLLKTTECEIRIISRYAQNNFETYICDFESESIPERALESVDTVFHLAGYAHDTRGDSKVEGAYQKINVDTTIELAKIAIDKGVKRFIFVSSVKAGSLDTVRISSSEKKENMPEGFYGKSKRAAELKLLEMGESSGMHISIVRPALVYGPGVKGNLRKMISGIKNGWFPPLPQTNNCRSMIHVDDLIRAMLFVANDYHTNGEIYIATDGMSYTSREIYEVMCMLADKSIPKWVVPKVLFKMITIISPSMKSVSYTHLTLPTIYSV